MKNKIIKQIEQEIKPLIKLKNKISLIYIYGSFVRQLKEKEQGFEDIDILVVADDFVCTEKDICLIEDSMEQINKNKKIKLHFQPVKILSSWWKGVINGEPWILTSLKYSYVLYDKNKIIQELINLIKLEKTYNKEEKAEELMESSNSFELENRRLLLESIKILSDIATESAQIFLLINNKFILDKEKIAKELENTTLKNYSGIYKEIIDLDSKMERGFLSEFTAKNLDYYLFEIEKFISQVEKVLEKI